MERKWKGRIKQSSRKKKGKKSMRNGRDIKMKGKGMEDKRNGRRSVETRKEKNKRSKSLEKVASAWNKREEKDKRDGRR